MKKLSQFRHGGNGTHHNRYTIQDERQIGTVTVTFARRMSSTGEVDPAINHARYYELWGSRRRISLILNLGTRRGHLHAPTVLPLAKEPTLSTEQGLGRP